jgi:dinuclear metal center YbgI/SA1388 family protein
MMEQLAPLELAEEWDNCGLQVGDPNRPVDRVLLALDMDEAVLAEAIDREAGLVITHHPLLFKGLKQIREDRGPGRLLSAIIRSGVTVYSAHTNLDSAPQGVNAVLARCIGLTGARVLRPGRERYLKLVVFVPLESVEAVREALAGSGAGWIGGYRDCAFMMQGTGTFRPLEGTNPYLGRTGELSRVEETRLETIIPARMAGSAVQAMLAAHPYEEVAYDLYPLENKASGSGIGRVGLLQEPVSFAVFTGRVKEALGLKGLRCGGDPARQVKTVAVCGGSGGDFWPLALGAGADVLVTGDIGYHGARDMLSAGLNFIDAGHYGTERLILEPVSDYLRDRCRAAGLDVDVIVSGVCGDPYGFV